MRIGIDAHCIGHRKTGNETYTYNLVRHLDLLDPDGTDYIVYVTAKALHNGAALLGLRSRTKLIWPDGAYFRIPVGFALESRAEKLDLFHAQYFLPHHLPCRTVLTVHDVIYERFPEFFPSRGLRLRRIGIPWSCRRAGHVITVSEYSKRDLVELYRLDPERVTVTYEAPDPSCRPLDAEDARQRLRRVYQIGEDFILYVGTIQPRKNIPRLLSAFARLKRSHNLPHKLAIVGPKAWLAGDAIRSLEEHPFRDEIIVTGYVSREMLPCFYNCASVFVYPSICEGFGLPVVEAMACGAPTITSRGSSLEEIAGDAAVLVDPLDVSAIASAMDKVLSDSDLRARLRASGLARSGCFSWQKMAAQTHEVYRRALN